MTSSISGSTSAMSFMRMQRPDPSQMAGKLFSKLDTKNQGYIEKSDLQSAFDNISGTTSSSSSTNVDDIFKQLDSDSDGKVTKDEMSSSLSKLAEQLDSQFNNMRMNGFGGMPPKPPQGGNDAGFTKDELTSQLNDIGSSDSKRSELISQIVSNFDQADTDGDGKISMKEAMAYDKSNSSSSSSNGSNMSGTSSSTEAAVMQKIMQLMQAYGGIGQDSSQSSLASLLSVSA